MKKHSYKIRNRWTGNIGKGTAGYSLYSRAHLVEGDGKKTSLELSSDPNFRGDTQRYNPEELLVASLSSCHMLWYLHLCADAGVVVIDYGDEATGTMMEEKDGSGQFEEVCLRPRVKVENESMAQRALELHLLAHEKCFISRSCNFPVKILPEVKF